MFFISRRHPLEKGFTARRLVAYVGAAVLCLGLCAGWFHVLKPEPFPPPHEVRLRDEAPPGVPEPREPRRHDGPPVLFVAAWGLPIFLAVVGLAHAAHRDRLAKERERRALAMETGLAKARLDALRMQLQPHFLFNSLNAVAELTHRDADRADEMIVALAAFLRLTLDTPGDVALPLARELEFTELYLHIERMRFGERLEIVKDIAPGALPGEVPPFILQPLVENAVRHGLSPAPAITRVVIRARRDGDALVLRVADNGAPKPESTVRERVGLSNVRERLDAVYGGKAALTYRHENGFVVEIRIPFRA